MISARAKRLYIITATVALSVLILGLSLLAPILSTTEDFSIYNTGWNGTSDLAVTVYRSGRMIPTLAISSTDSDLTVLHLPLNQFELDPAASSLIIIGPSKLFSVAEGELVGEFVRNGGKLLLADDFGTGNTLLKAMNATSRFSRYLLMDLAFEKQPEFSVCFDLSPDSNVTAGVTTFLMNYPSTIDVGVNTSVIAWSSVASYKDIYGDHLRNWSDPRGPFPIIAIEKLGLGEILLMSDPSILINGMLRQADNEALANNTMLYLGEDRGEVFFDESHRNYFDPVSISIMAIGELSDFAKALIMALIAMVLLTFLTDYPRILLREITRRALWLWRAILRVASRKKVTEGELKPLTDTELVVAVMERHPDWRRSMLTHLLTQADYHRKSRGW